MHSPFPIYNASFRYQIFHAARSYSTLHHEMEAWGRTWGRRFHPNSYSGYRGLVARSSPWYAKKNTTFGMFVLPLCAWTTTDNSFSAHSRRKDLSWWCCLVLHTPHCGSEHGQCKQDRGQQDYKKAFFGGDWSKIWWESIGFLGAALEQTFVIVSSLLVYYSSGVWWTALLFMHYGFDFPCTWILSA